MVAARRRWHRAGLLVLLLGLIPVTVLAAVTIVSFEAAPQGQSVLITWETASEVNMQGFFVQRASQEEGEYERVSEIIPAVGDIVGASYVYTDTDVEAGNTYYYLLEAMEADSSKKEFHGPISATLPLDATATPTPAVTASPTPTSHPSTSTPTHTPAATSIATPTPSPTVTLTFTPSPTYTTTPTLTYTPSPTSTLIMLTPTATSSPTPTPTVTFTPTPTSPPVPADTPTPTPTVTPSPAPLPTPTSTSIPTEAPSLTPIVVAVSPSPSPVPSSSSILPTPEASPTRYLETGEGTSLPWGLLLVLVGVGGGLILLGALGLWLTRGRK